MGGGGNPVVRRRQGRGRGPDRQAFHWPPGAEIFAALAAVLGHLFPVWLGFKGGKGVATFLGVAMALYWPAGSGGGDLAAGGIDLAHLISVGADRHRAVTGLFLSSRPAANDAPATRVLAALIFFMHRDNIRRLLRGEEPRIGGQKPEGANPHWMQRKGCAWLRLARSENVGPVTFAGLIARFGSAGRGAEEVPRLATRRRQEFVLPPPSDAPRRNRSSAKAGRPHHRGCEPDFPFGLAALDPPPPLIAVIGRMHLLQKEMVAIVGARNASALARKFAQILARDLGEAGLVIASGLARGIDSAAHEAGLEHGTVAVVAGGVDIVYPPENETLYRAIAERGAVISEMRLGEAPQARHFPRRNRLISGLARGVVVVEAAERSGSLITANYALEQGREIFAVPGSPLDPRAKGANRLIREGATLTESAEDVLAVLRPILGGGFGEPESAP